MDYEKKVLVLKQTSADFSAQNKQITGIVRIECENGVADCFITLINVGYFSDTEYFVYVVDGKKNVSVFPVGKRPTHINAVFDIYPDLTKGFCAGLIAKTRQRNVVAAFSRSQDSAVTVDKFYDLIKSKLNVDTEIQTEFKQEYDDEAVATENYYETAKDDLAPSLTQNIEDKLEYIKRLDNATLRPENDLPYNFDEEEEKEGGTADFGFQNETDATGGKEYSHQNPYYKSAEKELEEIFEKFPLDTSLNKFFPDSKWAKINYSAEKYYVVGIIKENGAEKYICYGVPATYSETPPKELDGFCSFIPLSVFNLKGEGFWMMFQDAITGACVKLT